MEPLQTPPLFWSRWLLVVALGVRVFDLDLVVAPGFARGGLSLLVNGDPQQIAAFGAVAVACIALVPAALEALLFG